MFVGRKKEMQILRDISEDVRNGNSHTVIIEGSAGIGKTAFIKEFKKNIRDFKIFESKARLTSQYKPYDVFLNAFGARDIRKITQEVEKEKIREIARNLIKNKKMIFVDEYGNDGTLEIYKILRRKMKGIIVSPNPYGDIFVSEVEYKKSMSPYTLESLIEDEIYKFVRKNKDTVILIENINYFIYSIGIEKVTFFLRDLYSTMKDNIVIVSGNLFSLSDEEKNKLSSIFDEVYSLEWNKKYGDTVYLISSVDDINKKNTAIFSDKRLGMGEYTVSEGGELRASMPNFSLLYNIIESAKSEKDIVINCMRSLIDYNGFREAYPWLKKVADIVRIRGVKLYISAEELREDEVEKIRSIVDMDFSENRKEAKPYKIYENVLNYLERYSQRKRICMIIEDIQWADRDSYLLLDYLSRNMEGGILLILTYRNEDISLRKDYRIIRGIMKYEKTHLVRLNPLSREDCYKILEEIGIKNKEIIYEKSGGNPLFLIQLSEHTHRNKKFIPDTMRESVEYQIENIDDLTLYNLRFLSTLGYEINKKIVDSLLGKDWIEKIENYDKFIEIDGKIKFKNSIIRDTIYNMMIPDLRLEMHYRIGKYFLKKSTYDAAYHFYKSRKKEGITHLKRAAETSIKNYAIDDAIDYYEKALEIADKYSLYNEIFNILERAGDIKMMIGRYKEAIKDYEKILEKNKTSRVLRKIGSCYLSIGDFNNAENVLNEGLNIARGFEREKILEQIGRLHLRKGKIDIAIKYFKKYLEASQRKKSEEDISLAYEDLAVSSYYHGDYRKSLDYAKKSMVYLRKSKKYERIVSVYNLLGAVYDTIGDKDKAMRNYKILLNLARKMGDLRGMSLAYNNIGILYYSIGTLEDVREYLEKALELHRKIGDIRSIALSYYNLSGVYSDEGKFDKAIDYGKKALEIYKKIGDMHGVSSSEIWIGIYHINTGEYKEAKKHINEGLKIARKEKYMKNIILSYIGIIKIYNRSGKLNLAKRYLNKLEECIGKNEKDIDILANYYINVVEYYLEKNDIEEAEKRNEQFEELADRADDIFLKTENKRLKSFIECKKGNLGNAEKYFNESIKKLKSIKMYYAMAEAYLLYGKYLLEKNEKLGREKILIARELFSSMNLKKRTEEINKILGEGS